MLSRIPGVIDRYLDRGGFDFALLISYCLLVLMLVLV